MNERIMELATQAGLYNDWNGKPWPTAMSCEECNAAYARFAELIVKGCIAQVRKDENGPAYEAATRIWEHFGDEHG